MRSFVLGFLTGACMAGGGLYLWMNNPAPDSIAAVDTDAGTKSASKRKSAPKRRAKRREMQRGVQTVDERVVLSAADRKVRWQGPSVTLPDRKLDFETIDGARSLSQSEINDGVRSGSQAFSECIGTARGQAEMTANITLKFLVSDTGTVGKVQVRAPSYLHKNGLYSCFKDIARDLQFPSTGSPTVVTVPFDLSY